MQLMERDRKILRTCYEQQFLLMDQVDRYFFQTKSKREPYRRIQELEKAGLVRRDGFFSVNGKRAIRLTRTGSQLASGFSVCEVAQPKHIDPVTFEHDSIVTSVRLRLAQLWDGLWLPEGYFRAMGRGLLPDGMIEFPSGVCFAIEVEHSQKERRRFLGLLREWAGHSDRHEEKIGMVLYVATRPGRFETLQRYLSESQDNRRMQFGLVLWSELESGKPMIWTPQGEKDYLEGRSYSFREET